MNNWRKIIEDYVKVLRSLDHATIEVCLDRLLTSSMVRPINFGIQSLLEEYISINPKVGLFAKNLLITSKTKFEKFLHNVYIFSMMLIEKNVQRFKSILLNKTEKDLFIIK